MLILSRHPGEVIYIGESIAIEVLDIRDGRVRLGITAPPEIEIWRAELLPVDDERREHEARR